MSIVSQILNAPTLKLLATRKAELELEISQIDGILGIVEPPSSPQPAKRLDLALRGVPVKVKPVTSKATKKGGAHKGFAKANGMPAVCLEVIRANPGLLLKELNPLFAKKFPEHKANASGSSSFGQVVSALVKRGYVLSKGKGRMHRYYVSD